MTRPHRFGGGRRAALLCGLAFGLPELARAQTQPICGTVYCTDVQECAGGDKPYCVTRCYPDEQDETGCSGHSSLVVWNAGAQRCDCTCRNQWTGPTNKQCSECPAEFGGSDCDGCQAGRINFPTCTECTVAADCSGNAGSVSTDGPQTKCTCECNSWWTGDNCGTCPPQYEQASCDKCAAGYTGSPPSCQQCSVATHCQNHATAVTSDAGRTTCVCTCAAKWEGNTCSTCPSQYEQTSCSSCAPGHVNYDTCTKCTVAANCNNHASAVDTNPAKTKCTCTCSDRYDGEQCERCSAAFEGYPNCGSCAKGYVGFPQCTLCDTAVQCSAHATSVDTDVPRTKCVCTCRNEWSGDNCGTCPTEFEQQQDCSQCSAGRIGYPTCEQCTSAKHCNNRATSVDANSQRSACVCQCQSEFGGSTCNQCANGYFGTYPNCVQCNSAQFCNDHADSAAPDPTQTKCVCQCSSAYEGEACDKCSAGHINYPTCTQCTSAAHCSGHAASVEDEGTRTSCVCTCRKQWTGGDCSSCDTTKYDQAQDCGQCAAGRIGYPTCEQCTNAANCNNNANSVDSNNKRTKCTCDCKSNFGGETCGECATQFEGFPTCSTCAAGYINYPTCTQCTSKDHCSNHAASVDDDGSRNSCVCTCSEQWTGADCSTCPAPKYDAAENCAQCSQGRINYPTCEECTVQAHCNGRATGVTSNNKHTACACTCEPEFGGGQCQQCANGYFGAYPNCVECTGAAFCNDHADSAAPD
eukprot:Hpha_TRINITY_DN15982_c1_g3::TRINITY_DN15982_c1_g3_i2::g.75482::m.75482